jgi:hypothetical protein
MIERHACPASAQQRLAVRQRTTVLDGSIIPCMPPVGDPL